MPTAHLRLLRAGDGVHPADPAGRARRRRPGARSGPCRGVRRGK
jgi:hypothetical protein